MRKKTYNISEIDWPKALTLTEPDYAQVRTIAKSGLYRLINKEETPWKQYKLVMSGYTMCQEL